MKKFFSAFLFFLATGALAHDCTVTCTKLVSPTAEVDFFWKDENPGQCPNEEACVPGCDGSCSPFCLEEEIGQTKPGLCVTFPPSK